MILFGQKEDAEDVVVRRRYRQVFSGQDGRYVLACILRDLGFFDMAHNDEQRVLQNYARHLLEQMGMLHEYNATAFVESLFNLPVWEKKQGRDS